jgi:hypothetical protein
VTALKEYSSKYPIDFAILSIGIQSNSLSEEEAFERLKKEIAKASLKTPKIEWVVYLLKEDPFYDETNRVYIYNGNDSDDPFSFARDVEGFLFKDGKLADSFGKG